MVKVLQVKWREVSADNTFSIMQLRSGCRSVVLDIHLSIWIGMLCFIDFHETSSGQWTYFCAKSCAFTKILQMWMYICMYSIFVMVVSRKCIQYWEKWHYKVSVIILLSSAVHRAVNIEIMVFQDVSLCKWVSVVHGTRCMHHWSCWQGWQVSSSYESL